MTSNQTMLLVLVFCFLALCQGFVPNEIQSRGASNRAVKTAPTVLYMGLIRNPPKKQPRRVIPAS
jgi:hypothetical protein